jgi:hypothetical protein
MAEVQREYDTLAESNFHRLIQRSFSMQSKFNFIYVMQPIYLPKGNKET